MEIADSLHIDISLRGLTPHIADLESAYHTCGRMDCALENAQGRLYDRLALERFGEDFRGIFLFGSSDFVTYRTGLYDREHRQTLAKAGHWDYADTAYQFNQQLASERASRLRSLGLLNPELIPEHAMFVDGPESDLWDRIMDWNKTTRLVPWTIGDWPLRPRPTAEQRARLKPGAHMPFDMPVPNCVGMGSYDVALLQSDQSVCRCAPKLVMDLLRPGGIAIARSNNGVDLTPEEFLTTGKAQMLLHGPNLSYSAYGRK